MSAPARPKATEERLREIREAAAQTGVGGAADPPRIQGHDSYYRLPALKTPVWTWEVPLYFFIGGISGVSAAIAFVAQLFHADPSLIRFALWIALAGAAVCPIFLIADLGRPQRFLYMLRVFKLRSPMSMGVWILVAFSGCVFLAVVSNELAWHGFAFQIVIAARWLGEAFGALTGLLLASYTGVLLGATAIPVWFQNRRILPAYFLTAGLGGSAGLLELAGFLIPSTQILGFVASALETGFEVSFEIRKSAVDEPLHHGRSGVTFRLAGLLEGPIALLVRVFWGSLPAGRYGAAICFLVGALLGRYAWIWAGSSSAQLPETQFALQRSGGSKP